MFYLNIDGARENHRSRGDSPDFSSHFAVKLGGVCRGREVGHLRQAMGGACHGMSRNSENDPAW